MSYSTGFLHDVVAILNRDEPDDNSSFGLDANGITWHQDCCVHANVGYSKGKAGMNVGALDVYAVKLVRMRWNCHVCERSRISFNGKTYQILGETFNANRQADEIQFLMQTVDE